MARVVKAKWGIGSDKPEDLPDFLTNDEILEKNGEKYPRGRFRLHIKEITVKKNNSDNDMMVIRCEVNETDKAKKSYNGWFLITNQNITDQGKPYLLKFLKAIGATWNDFMENTRTTPETSVEPTKILSIGPVKFTGNAKVYADALLVKDVYKDEERSQIGRWVPKSADSDEEEVEETEEEELEEEEAEAEEEAEEEELEMSEEEEELREELEDLTKVKLKARAKKNGATLKDYKDLDEEGLIDLIVEQEIELEDEEEPDEEEEEETEDDSEAEDELREELDGLTIAALKSRAKKNKRKLAEYKTAKKPELIEMIVEDELGGEDENEPPF
jgi:hypothetical protein